MRTAEILPLLPEVMREAAEEGTPLLALVDTMAGLHERDERILATLDAWFDPRRTPDRFLPYLASWVDLGWIPVSGPGPTVPLPRLRHLLALAPELARRRGTAEGLALLLRTATGVAELEVLESGDAAVPEPFHVVVRVPYGARDAVPLVELLVRAARPAHVMSAVAVAPAPLSTDQPVEEP